MIVEQPVDVGTLHLPLLSRPAEEKNGLDPIQPVQPV